MNTPGLTVIKVGGSLFDLDDLEGRLRAVLAEHGPRVLMIAGGGKVVDVVRELDQRHRLGDQTAHDLALWGLDFTAILLCAFLPECALMWRPLELELNWAGGRVPVLKPAVFLDAFDRQRSDALPASWRITSDSIAARVAVILAADHLVLLKSAPAPVGSSRAAAARLGLVDPCFPEIARTIQRVSYINLRDPLFASIPLAADS